MQGRYFGADIAKGVVNGGNVEVAILIDKVHGNGHDDDGQERTRQLLVDFGCEGNDEDTHNADGSRHPVDGGQMVEVDTPLGNEVSRQAALNAQTQQVFDLGRKDGDGNTAGKSHYDGVGNELDNGAQAAKAQQDEKHSRQHGGQHQSGQAQGGVAHNAEDNHNKRSGRTTNLYPAAAKCRNQETTDNGRKDTL